MFVNEDVNVNVYGFFNCSSIFTDTNVRAYLSIFFSYFFIIGFGLISLFYSNQPLLLRVDKLKQEIFPV